jgi:hypothetical protein
MQAFDRKIGKTSAGFAARGVLLTGMIAGVGMIPARAQTVVPDSQVEANVLKALAGAPELASQTISTNTVYGVVTLSGTVQDEALRTKAENLAANAVGVKKVVDELQIGANAASSTGAGNQPGPGMVLQSDGTYAPATNTDATASLPPGSPTPGTAPASGAVMNDPDHDQAAWNQSSGAQAPNGQVPGAQQPQPYSTAPQYPQGRYPAYPQGYAQNGYPPQGGAPYGGQAAGQPVTVPVGTMVRIRVNRLLASDQVKAGDHFDGVVANDVVAGGFVAIPRGASVQGVVVAAKSSGAISGRGELSLQLTSVVLAGKVYPVVSDVWVRNGPDKTVHTVNNAAGLGVMGALIGAVAGRGAGAAIGAGVGAAAGVGASAASPKGQVVIPPEGVVAFNLSQPAQVQTVSEQEMQRLAYGVPSGQRQPMYPRAYPGYYPAYPPPVGYPAY